MKLLSVTIPSYNSEEYMANAIESAVSGGEEVEVLVIDDGSSDHTLQIAKQFEEKYPTIVKAIHKENGGHGSAVNTGLANATGLYFKVLDSDDWFDKESLQKILKCIRKVIKKNISLDLLINNYVYEKPSANKQTPINYYRAIPNGKLISWSDLGHFKMSQNLLMHSMIYRTQLLRDCHLQLPEHTFYVDNIFAFTPLPHVNSMYYLDVNLYRYFIGRDDQSVNESVMIKRIDQQIKITKIMIDSHDLLSIKNKKLRNYMIKYLSMMMIVSSALLVRDGSLESLEKRDELWRYLKKADKKLYQIISVKYWGYFLQLESKPGRKFIELGYLLTQKIYNFN